MEKYETVLDKVALAVESAKVAKAEAVKKHGIGEDINISLFGWRGSDLVVISQMIDSGRIEKEERFAKIVNMLCVVRQGWQVDGFTMIAEAFCSLSPADTKGKDLGELFAQPDSPVSECLAVTHISLSDGLFVTVPYTVALPRTVVYGTPQKYSGYDEVFRDKRYPVAIGKVLDMKLSEHSEDGDYFHRVLARGLAEEGFDVHYL